MFLLFFENFWETALSARHSVLAKGNMVGMVGGRFMKLAIHRLPLFGELNKAISLAFNRFTFAHCFQRLVYQ